MIQEKQLAQSYPTGTSAASIYSPPANLTAIIKTIIICNSTTSSATFRIFIDDNGTTYDATTALFYDVIIQGNETIQIDSFYPMNNSSGNLAVRTDTGSALTFTVFGAEIN